MADKKPDSIIPSSQGSTLRDLILRIKLILRLMGDPRVNPLLKLIPIASLIYLVMPVDLAPGVAFPVIGALDDAAIVWLGAYLFIELCPPDVVQEHLRALQGKPSTDEEIVDAEAVELPPEDEQ